MSVDFFIFAVLLLVNGLLAVAMLLAARTLGQPKMAMLLAAAFGGNVLLYASDATYFFLFKGDIWVNLAVSAIAMTPPILAAMAYRMRSGLPSRTLPLVATHAAGLLLILWYSIVDPDRGMRSAIVPLYAAAVLLFGVTTALAHPGRKLRLGNGRSSLPASASPRSSWPAASCSRRWATANRPPSTAPIPTSSSSACRR
ncbi:hypothetical protein ACFSTI_00835 [Rhizorhabdus histidinilytica]